MIKSKYSKDNLYLRALEREKNQQRIKESNKEMRKIVNYSRDQIKHFQRLRKNNVYEPDTSFKSPKMVKSFNVSEQSHYSEDSVYRNKIMQPISNKADEYEKAIQQFLGVGQAEVQVEKLRKGKKIRSIVQVYEKRPQSSVEFSKDEPVKDVWDEELKRIEAKEKSLQKNLNDLSKKQKSINHLKGHKTNLKGVKAHSRSFKETIKPKKNNSDIFKSLEQVNKVLTNFLKNAAPQIRMKK